MRIRPLAMLGALVAAVTPSNPVARLVNAAKRGRAGVRALLQQEPTRMDPKKAGTGWSPLKTSPRLEKIQQGEIRNRILHFAATIRRKEGAVPRGYKHLEALTGMDGFTIRKSLGPNVKSRRRMPAYERGNLLGHEILEQRTWVQPA